jgi:hypothetical protein
MLGPLHSLYPIVEYHKPDLTSVMEVMEEQTNQLSRDFSSMSVDNETEKPKFYNYKALVTFTFYFLRAEIAQTHRKEFIIPRAKKPVIIDVDADDTPGILYILFSYLSIFSRSR